MANKSSEVPTPESSFLARVGLAPAPGKRLARGRDGLEYSRSIRSDVLQLKELGIRLIVCLLSKSELRSLGVVQEEYEAACNDAGVRLECMPCQECAAFEDIESVVSLCEDLWTALSEDREACIFLHCRGGIGRAGTLAACLLLTVKHKLRVESPQQEDADGGNFLVDKKKAVFGNVVVKGTRGANKTQLQFLQPRRAIRYTRSRRTGAIESRNQEDCVTNFARLLEQRREDSRLFEHQADSNLTDRNLVT